VGDLVGVAVSGALNYVPYKEFERIRMLSVDAVKKTELFASLCRINTLYMIACAGSGHIGSSFSSMDIMCWLQLNELRTAAPHDSISPNDIFFSSKGHDAPGLYNTWIGLGKLDFDLIHQLRRINGLPGHPDISTPNVVTNTGSLGMGVSKAKGMIFANRLQKKIGNVFVLTGDGELQEGQFWESLISAANHKLHELIVIIDHNKLQSDTLVSRVSDLGDLEAKLAAFGWHVSRCDGNNVEALSKTLAATKTVADKPKIIIADTIKGKGVSFMEHTSIDSDIEFYKFHSGAPTDDAYIKAAQELIDTANNKLSAVQASTLELEIVNRPVAIQPENPQRLIQAYSNALLEQARKNSKIVALDADLILDTGLIPFQREFPDRFLECGIAEQDMVSQAGGIALQGLLPIVHSFACFLSSRPNEQIYNNATEQEKIIYVGSLAGMLPGGPGHSHQAVRDIAALAAMPGMVLMEPSCEAEVGMLLNWAINENTGSSYLRLVSIPWAPPYTLPASYKPELGKGVALTKGKDIAIITYGLVMLSIAVEVARTLTTDHGISATVINLPWLNQVDAGWLAGELEKVKHCFVIDNHYRIGGQGDRIADAMLANGIQKTTLHRMALDQIPACGTNPEILQEHGFDVTTLSGKIRSIVVGPV
jgi:transketolase